MPRKITTPNPGHPHTRLKAFQAQIYNHHRNMSNEVLDRAVREVRRKYPHEEEPLGRSQKLALIERVATREFKAEWKNQYGWDFDDSYDPKLLSMHVANHLREQRARERMEAAKA